ncbi:MAG: ATP-dependent DNA ligase [Pyrinomonas methylaliphatogenes]|nr:ATP-dependent DNA ligase [Pyrinomonas methylaliphatogenes]
MRFETLAEYFEKLEGTTERLRMYELLGQLFARADPEETAELAYLCEGRLLPAFAGVEIGMGERLVARAIAIAAGVEEREVTARYKRLGDLGSVAEELLKSRRQRGLTVTQAYAAMLEIARTSGPGSVEGKAQKLAALLGRTSPRAARYIVRFALGRMRLGIGAPTIIEAIARTSDDSKRARALIERAYNLCSDLGLVLRTMREQGIEALSRFHVRVGNPVRMMLAERLPSAEEIIARLGRCAVEAKLDGLRCQVHLNDERVEIFSRNLERMTGMFPDIAEAIKAQVAARQAIIEGEAVAINEATGEFYPFQVTVKRKRKHGIEEMAREFPLALVVFDLLYVDGRDYTELAYQARREALEGIIKKAGRIRPVERIITASADELQRFFDAQVERGMEGIIAKRLDSPYLAGARNFNWIKLKRAYRGQLEDTVDVVIVGYLRGRGARARFGIGALLTAVYDRERDSFCTIAKVGSGLSDEGWTRLREMLDRYAVEEKPARVESRLVPDVWVEPRYVITVLADEITRSPVHTCAQDESGTGLALRFPRVVGFIREDKAPEDATTVEEIREMYATQKRQKLSS